MTATSEPGEARDGVADIPIPPPFPHPVPHPPVPGPAPTITPLPSPTLGGAIGCDFRSGLNQLLFVEFSGNLSRMNLFPSATVLEQWDHGAQGHLHVRPRHRNGGRGQQPGRHLVGADDERRPPDGSPRTAPASSTWGRSTLPACRRRASRSSPIRRRPSRATTMRPTSWSTATSSRSAPKPATSPRSWWSRYGYDLTIEWVTYQLHPMYQVLGTGYNQPEDVKASQDGVHAYVTERTGDPTASELVAAPTVRRPQLWPVRDDRAPAAVPG